MTEQTPQVAGQDSNPVTDPENQEIHTSDLVGDDTDTAKAPELEDQDVPHAGNGPEGREDRNRAQHNG